MNVESKPARPRILRVLAWAAAMLLLVCWGSIGAAIYGVGGHLLNYIFLWSLVGAFVIGLSSCEPLGGISACLSALTLIGWLALAVRTG